jgi:cytochrome c553
MRWNQALGVFAVSVISLGVPVLAHAAGNAAAGKAKAAACMACHVAIGDDTPHLAGQRPTYIAKQLKAFKAGDRKNPVMNGITKFFDDTTIDDLAAFWSSQPADSDTTLPPEIAGVKKSKMTFPREFPKGFILYSTVNKDGQNAVAEQYINKAGLDALKASKPLPSGTVIMVVNSSAKLDPDGKPVEKNGSWVPDKLKGYEGMELRTGWSKDVPELLRNEPTPNTGWGYALFSADKAPKTEVNQAICLACHVPARDTAFVFGLKKMQAKAGAK